MTEMSNEFKRELDEVRTNFRSMAQILRDGRSVWHFKTPPMGKIFDNRRDMMRWYDYQREVVHTIKPHKWHSELQRKYSLHKAIDKCMALARPADWHQLLMEWPHIAETDATRLAYTRDERGGENDRQVITTIGKYITRHFPTLASHHVRDIVALFSADQCKQVHTIAEMLYHLHRGPQSCMKWNCNDDEDLQQHPYNCYDPRLGWSMAIREEGGDTVARALVYKQADGVSYFVRSYTKNDTFSHSDTILEAWLNSQGIHKRGDWEDAKLAKVSRGNNSWGKPMLVFPYIDGGVQTVDVCDDYMLVNTSGEYLCNNTDGSADDNERECCADCGDHGAADDGYWVGRSEGAWVCNSCHDDYYYAYGQRGRQYYVHQDNVVHVDCTPYDTDYLGDNNIVELYDGEYSDLDHAVYVESQDAYYGCDDNEICRTRDDEYELVDDCVLLADGDYCLKDEAWECMHSNEWYHNSVDYVLTADGEKIHPDYADECDMPDDYEAPEVVAVVAEPVKEVAAEPVLFTPVPMNASPSLRDEVIYDVDGLRITKCAYQNIDLIRYQASKRVFERELAVAHNALRMDFAHEDGVEARIVANLCEQIANMEARLHLEFFTTQMGQRYRDHLQAAMGQVAPAVEQALIQGHSYTSMTWDESAGVVFAAAPTTLIGE